MKNIKYIILLSAILIISSCITQFVPDASEEKELLVVEGLITDQPEINTIKLSLSRPLGRKNVARPLSGCIVSVVEGQNNTFQLTETDPGTYVTDPALFRGKTGNSYTLRINTDNTPVGNFTFESVPMEMKPVPPVDTLYYETKTIRKHEFGPDDEGIQIYLNTYDPTKSCQFYRWDFTETWEFQLPYYVPNRVCWLTNRSGGIFIKNTSILAEDRINRFPLNFVSNETDRLSVKYSLMVNQYSLSEDEFSYWERLQNITEEVGSLYDLTPASIPGNISCVDDPNKHVLGYFSVSARSSKRVFIKENLSNIVNLYNDCPSDTIMGTDSIDIPGLDQTVWVIYRMNMSGMPPYRVITEKHGCADCSVRGTTVRPDFWTEEK
jgi:hypothetical protein